MRLDELISKKDKYKKCTTYYWKKTQAKEQTTNHKAAPLPGVFLGEESILYTGKTSGAVAHRVFFLVMRIYNRKKQVRIQDEAFKDKTRYMYRYKYKNSIKLYFCNNYVRKITGKSYGFFSEIIIYYEL